MMTTPISLSDLDRIGPDLPLAATKVLITIIRRAGDDRRARVSHSKVMALVGVSKPTLIAAMRQLEDAGHLKVLEQGTPGNGGTLYEIAE